MADPVRLTWRARVLWRFVHRDARTADGVRVSIWAFPRGIRPSAAWSQSIAPDLTWIFTVLRAVFEHARYRIVYRGAWVVEIRNPDSDLPLDDRLLRSRAEAMDLVEATCTRIGTITLNHIGKALGV